MDAPDYVREAQDAFAAACREAARDSVFAETAAAVRKQMGLASVCLLRSAVLRARARRQAIGRRHFDWDTPPRGEEPQPVGRA